MSQLALALGGKVHGIEWMAGRGKGPLLLCPPPQMDELGSKCDWGFQGPRRIGYGLCVFEGHSWGGEERELLVLGHCPCACTLAAVDGGLPL